MPNSYYRRHVFFCLNQREAGEACCAAFDAEDAFNACKKAVRDACLDGPGGVRVNRAGCLNRCAGGPVAVVYPDAVWYTFVDSADIEEIVSEHLVNGRPVQRLILPESVGR